MKEKVHVAQSQPEKEEKIEKIGAKEEGAKEEGAKEEGAKVRVKGGENLQKTKSGKKKA